ncbi:MAG: NAD(P)H-binding protein [Thermoplasmata archaeon]|nr:MAG: NAD(P)H-binding protein [Thermoplasmata archaeon]
MDIDRYKKQILVKEFSKNGQDILLQTHVVIIGAGGIGSNSSVILTRMGVGQIELIDDDVVDVTNLHRTSIFNENDVGKPKSKILEKKLGKINSDIRIVGYKKKVTRKNIEKIIRNADIVLDGTDNMQTRFLINDACIKNNIPWVYAGVRETIGMTMGIIPNKTPCLRCISNIIPSRSDPHGVAVLGNLPIVTASIQSIEAIKILLGKQPYGLIIYDLWRQHFEQIDLKKKPYCICCSRKKFEFLQRNPGDSSK